MPNTLDYGGETLCLDQSGDCPDHGRQLGKFQDCLSETVWVLSLDQGTPIAEGGSQDGPGYFALMRGGDGLPHRYYIIESLSSGAVYVISYDRGAEARRTWKRDYAPIIAAWDAQEEEEYGV